MSDGERRSRIEATPVVESLISQLEPACAFISAAGSYRRERITVGDLEIVAVSNGHLHDELDHLLELGFIQKSPLRNAWGMKQRKFMYDGWKIDCYIADADNLGYILWLRTGGNDGADGQERIMRYINRRREVGADKPQFVLEKGYLWHGPIKLRVPTESDFFALLGLPFIEPRDREGATYERYFKAADHKFGDATPYLPPPDPTVMQTDFLGLAHSTYAEDGGKSAAGDLGFLKMCESWAEQDDRIADRQTDPCKRMYFRRSARRWRAHALEGVAL